MNKQELLDKWSKPTKVGKDGYIRLVDVMGDDDAIVQAARTSYGKGTKSTREDRTLIRYLMRHGHWSPFQMCEIKLHIRLPIHVARQWWRHQADMNELSLRYSEADDSYETTEPTQWRLQSRDNKQGSEGLMHELTQDEISAWCKGKDTSIPLSRMETLDHWSHLTGNEIATYLSNAENESTQFAGATYETLIKLGVAREQARKVLPLSTYTEAYRKTNLRNTLHFLKARLDSHAQLEIRQFANAIADIVSDWVPLAWGAFEDYSLNAVTFSAQEMKALRYWLNNSELNEYSFFDSEYDDCNLVNLENLSDRARQEWLTKAGIETKRERIEFWNKLKGKQ